MEVLLGWLFRPGKITLKSSNLSELQSDSDEDYGEEESKNEKSISPRR